MTRPRLGLLQPTGNRFGELPEVIQLMSADVMDDVPVDDEIAVDGDVSESNGFCHAFSQDRLYDLKFSKHLEVFRHRGGRDRIGLRNEMRGDIDGNLDGALEIQRNDVLQVKVANKVVRRGGSLAGDSLDATPERLEFGFD
jgi:hypothetical protein